MVNAFPWSVYTHRKLVSACQVAMCAGSEGRGRMPIQLAYSIAHVDPECQVYCHTLEHARRRLLLGEGVLSRLCPTSRSIFSQLQTWAPQESMRELTCTAVYILAKEAGSKLNTGWVWLFLPPCGHTPAPHPHTSIARCALAECEAGPLPAPTWACRTHRK